MESGEDSSRRSPDEGSVRSSKYSDKDIKKKMDKLADMEKKFKEKKFFDEDPNREFVMQSSADFLQTVAKAEEEAKLVEEKESSQSSVFEQKNMKKTKVFVVDQGISDGQTQNEWEKSILERGFREAQRVYLTQSQSLHPFAVMSYLPYRMPNARKPQESSSSSSEATFSSSDSADSQNDDTEQSSLSYASKSSSSSQTDYFEVPQDAPKCHRGHIHKQGA